ncbi:Response regulator aspartate phosphatase (plasmid) [Bacillus subtilis subsp. subtilis]|uniref:response regulator aspartate phosphatase n=1 Tax=Bacillus subtilis TaxID=1423 RepID=UPI000B4BA6B1|nr:RapH N-terminal domain-containing protein [Bacillus subtilis]ASB72386.1 Response regulator aspartate phosphatase [Bacillus subtilis subsp. subtilis]
MLSKVKKVPSPYVGNLLNKWHDYIMQEKVHESIEKRTEIKQLLSQAEDNKDLVDYFILLDHRHSLCFDQEASMGDVVNMLSKGSHDLLINFYFELFAGDYEFLKKLC